MREHFEALINGCDAVCEHRLIQGVGQTASPAIHLVLGLALLPDMSHFQKQARARLRVQAEPGADAKPPGEHPGTVG